MRAVAVEEDARAASRQAGANSSRSTSSHRRGTTSMWPSWIRGVVLATGRGCRGRQRSAQRAAVGAGQADGDEPSLARPRSAGERRSPSGRWSRCRSRRRPARPKASHLAGEDLRRSRSRCRSRSAPRCCRPARAPGSGRALEQVAADELGREVLARRRRCRRCRTAAACRRPRSASAISVARPLATVAARARVDAAARPGRRARASAARSDRARRQVSHRPARSSGRSGRRRTRSTATPSSVSASATWCFVSNGQ